MDSLEPFGQTQITATEYEQLIEKNEAVDYLEAEGLSNPDERVEEFIQSVPDLLAWLDENGRDYPWRRTTDPWRIYVTEILLQRTRADAVDDIYESFFGEFPDPDAVVGATDQTIFQKVQSLGFGNQRTRSIREAAELCTEEFAGEVPNDLEALQRPWRVGRYSARACLLFAYGTPVAIVDSNIARIFERVLDCDMPEQPHKSNEVHSLVAAFIPSEPCVARAVAFAFLDLGALLCTDQSPNCSLCPLNDCCAFANQTL